MSKMKKNILVFNVGSSSVKYSLFKDDKQVLKENIANITDKKSRDKAVGIIIGKIKKRGARIDAISHRVVHGGDISRPMRIDGALLARLRKIKELAPLHDIPEIEVIEICRKHFACPQYAFFDTAFHQTMPEKAKVYGLPYKYYLKGIRKYGFHGISNEYISKGLKGKLIICHLGNGCSITAIKDGKSVDTSMGFTPVDGLVMSTRSGSIDPAIIPYMIKHERITIDRISAILNNESGLLGISGISYDLRDLLKSKSKRAKLAIDVFVDRVVKQIGAYTAILNGVDKIIFSAGITENNPTVRSMILEHLTHLGVKIDNKKNIKNQRVISSKGSKVEVLVIHTDEEKAIAEKTARFLK